MQHITIQNVKSAEQIKRVIWTQFWDSRKSCGIKLLICWDIFQSPRKLHQCPFQPWWWEFMALNMLFTVIGSKTQKHFHSHFQLYIWLLLKNSCYRFMCIDWLSNLPCHCFYCWLFALNVFSSVFTSYMLRVCNITPFVHSWMCINMQGHWLLN